MNTVTGRISNEAALYITSRKISAEEAATVARAHWQIEAYHHTLDVTYGEDACSIANENAAHNLGTVRRLVQSLLSGVDPKRSVPYKRRECNYDESYRARALGLTI